MILVILMHLTILVYLVILVNLGKMACESGTYGDFFKSYDLGESVKSLYCWESTDKEDFCDSGESGDFVGSGNSVEYGDPGEYSNFGKYDDFDEPDDFGYYYNSLKSDQYGQYGDCV